MSPSDAFQDSVEAASKGATKAALEHIEEKISSWVAKLNQGELSFIEDSETIERVKKQKTKPKWGRIHNLVKDRSLRILIQMGFCLRELELMNKKDKLLRLRDVILSKYGPTGLSVAEVTQRGLLDRYVELLITKTDDEVKLRRDIEEILQDVNKYVFFIKENEDIEKKAIIISARINGLFPRAIILMSKGRNAESKALEILKVVQNQVENYSLEIQKEPGLYQNYYFLLKDDSEPVFNGSKLS